LLLCTLPIAIRCASPVLTEQVSMRDALSMKQAHETARKIVLGRYLTVVVIISFLIYSCSTAVFQTFACVKTEIGSFLRADMTINWDAPRHISFEVFTAVFIFVYPLGIPAIFSWMIFRHRDRVAEAPPPRQQLDGDIAAKAAAPPPDYQHSADLLARTYRRERFYVEPLECLRRLMLTGKVLIFILPNTAAQVSRQRRRCWFARSVAGWFFTEPFSLFLIIELQFVGAVIIFLTMFDPLVIKAGNASPDSQGQESLAIVLIVMNVLLMCS
ncbi:unnamed protein product, partial [Phaeothamnion confervicola]